MLCALAHQFPRFVESFLQQGVHLSRRFREETVTDVLMGGLLSAGAPNVLVDYPNETATGADMRWDFVNSRRRTFFSLFIQAKKLYDRAPLWREHGYDELFHLAGSTGRLQSEILCDYARSHPATYPLYAFYNQGHSCDLARADGIVNVDGCSLGDGYEVERRVLAATNAAARKNASSLGQLQPLLFALSDILCPGSFIPVGPMAFAPGFSGWPPLSVAVVNGKPTMGYFLPPTPEDVRESLSLRIVPDAVGGESPVPEVSDIPADVESRILRHRDDGPPRDDLRGAPYWTVTIVSRDRDEEGAADFGSRAGPKND